MILADGLKEKEKHGLMYFLTWTYRTKTWNGLFWHQTWNIQRSENSYLSKQEMQYQEHKSPRTHTTLEGNLANAYFCTKAELTACKEEQPVGVCCVPAR